MISDKKNQHYIPKFYLRNFSINQNNKQIGVYHVGKGSFYPKSKLKTQGSKKFYYGSDGQLEDNISKVEGIISRTIKRIISTSKLPQKRSEEHCNLLFFTALTCLRNPVTINSYKDSIEQMKDALLAENPRTDIDRIAASLTHEEAIRISISSVSHIVEILFDLDYKLIINKTEHSFISSDLPVVKYNQFLEKMKWQFRKTGFGTVGLQIFIPLNPNLMIVFFDRHVYKVGKRKDKFIELKNELDVEKLNMLQVLNSFTTLFFNEKVSLDYITELVKKSSKYHPANITTTEMSYLLKPGENINNVQYKNLVVSGTTDCETGLDISGIYMHSGSKKIEKIIKRSNNVTHLRPRAIEILESIHK